MSGNDHLYPINDYAFIPNPNKKRDRAEPYDAEHEAFKQDLVDRLYWDTRGEDEPRVSIGRGSRG